MINLLGRWRITSMEQWDNDSIAKPIKPFIEIRKKGVT
jgi:hypothetical protein